MHNYITKYPDKDVPTQRWCFVRMKAPLGFPGQGEGKYLMWDGYKHWTGTGDDLFQNYEMCEIEYWLEQEEPEEINNF